MQSLVLFNLAALKAALVGPFRAPVIIVVDTLPGLCFAETVPWNGQKASVSSHRNELIASGGNMDIWCGLCSRATEQHPRVRASIITLAWSQVWEVFIVRRKCLKAGKFYSIVVFSPPKIKNLISKNNSIPYCGTDTLAYYFLDKHSCTEYVISGRGR